jgi:nucleotide-binding universal stress UspA family protein
MSGAQTILVAVEDYATASIVAVEAARLAREQETQTIILLHVLDPHAMVAALFSLSGTYGLVEETAAEGEAVLALAEVALSAEFAAAGTPAPAIQRVLVNSAEGGAGSAIAQVAGERGAELIVLGARRPHALGRLTHPDVRAYITGHTACPVCVASLQETPSS